MCKICGKETIPLKIAKLDYRYCQNCGYLCKTDEEILPSNLEKARYDLHHNDFSLDYFNYQEKFYFMIENYLGKKILDYGTGLSHMLPNVLEKYHYEVKYYDLYYFNNLEVLNETYDTIILEEVIEHLKNPLEVLTRLKKNLTSGGRFIIRTNLFKDVSNLNSWWYLRDTTHISFFQEETFKEISRILDLKMIFTNRKDLVILEK